MNTDKIIETAKQFIIDFFTSLFSPIESQKMIRRKDKIIEDLNELNGQKSQRINELVDRRIELNDQLHTLKMKHAEARELLSQAIFERMQIDDRASGITIGNEYRNDEIVGLIAQVHYEDGVSTARDLKTMIGKGETNVDAVINLYKKLKDSNLNNFENAEI